MRKNKIVDNLLNSVLKGIFFSFILLSFVVGCSKKTEEEEKSKAPVSEFSFIPVSPKTGQEVTFISTNAVSYQWSAIGITFSSTEKNPKFTFSTVGDFDVKLVVKNAAGQSNEVAKKITVKAASGGGNNTPCNLPDCYVTKTTSVG